MTFKYVSLVGVYCVYNISDRGVLRNLSNIYHFLFFIIFKNGSRYHIRYLSPPPPKKKKKPHHLTGLDLYVFTLVWYIWYIT